MEPAAQRSDSRSALIGAPPADVFAAMCAPNRIARWWGPAGFTSTIRVFDFRPGGDWVFTLHGPDGTDYPNENRFVRIERDRWFEIEHLSDDHHFVLTIELEAQGASTLVKWRQTFDTVEHYAKVLPVVSVANEQNLGRLGAEVRRGMTGLRESTG
jgi:uncharacterized protein YndB with AHSA1/START domain